LIDKDVELNIQGYDLDNETIKLARYHAKEAGVDEDIHFQQRDALEISSKYKYGFILCNPPYGERLGSTAEVEKLYKKMGIAFKKLDTWSYYVITSHERFEKIFGKSADKKRKLYNGRKECCYYQFYGPVPRKNILGDKIDTDDKGS
jgi:putative N6-adenine-specific DNA methylase